MVVSHERTSSPGLIGGRYRRLRLIGRGAHGQVWECEDVLTTQLVACKSIRYRLLPPHTRGSGAGPSTPTPPAAIGGGSGGGSASSGVPSPPLSPSLEEICAETSALRRLRGHPNVVRLEEVVADGTEAHVVMELCPGGDLLTELINRGPMDEPLAATLVRQLASAVAFCHVSGVMHRDVKPDNVLLVRPPGATAAEPQERFDVAVPQPHRREGLRDNRAVESMGASGSGACSLLPFERCERLGGGERLGPGERLGSDRDFRRRRVPGTAVRALCDRANVGEPRGSVDSSRDAAAVKQTQQGAEERRDTERGVPLSCCRRSGSGGGGGNCSSTGSSIVCLSGGSSSSSSSNDTDGSCSTDSSLDRAANSAPPAASSAFSSPSKSCLASPPSALPRTEPFRLPPSALVGATRQIVGAKLADFGVSAVVRAGAEGGGLGAQRRDQGAGTLAYMAPEMKPHVADMKRGVGADMKRTGAGDAVYGYKADVWSLGMTLCTILTARIVATPVDFGHVAWSGVSEPAKDLIRRMLQVDPDRRLSSLEVLEHPWLNQAAVRGRDAAVRWQTLMG